MLTLVTAVFISHTTLINYATLILVFECLKCRLFLDSFSSQKNKLVFYVNESSYYLLSLILIDCLCCLSTDCYTYFLGGKNVARFLDKLKKVDKTFLVRSVWIKNLFWPKYLNYLILIEELSLVNLKCSFIFLLTVFCCFLLIFI